jgi:hypothetical protein
MKCFYMDVEPNKPATKLRDIRSLCHPRPLSGSELETLFVETEAARDPNCGVRQSIKSILDDAGVTQRILVYGHRGCGKSTELALLTKELDAGWLCVNFSVLDELPPIGVHAEEVLLAITHQLVEAAKREKLDSLEQDERIKKVGDWFKSVTKTSEIGRDAQLELKAGAKASTGGWLFGLGELFAKISSDIKFRSATQTSFVEVVRKKPGDLIEQVNRVLESVQDALKLQEKRLLIIVEDLDKLSIADARSVFVENSNLLTGVQANIIYTIPIFTFYSPDASAMKAAFDRDFSLPMIKVLNPDGSHAKGFQIVKKIVHRRVDKTAIEDDGLNLLIEKTGGVLRHVFEVLQTASSMTSLHEPPIRRQHIEYALGRLKADIGTQIALPTHIKIEGVDKVTQLYDKLVFCVQKQREGKACPPTGDPIVQVLLQSCALVEYNGARWLGVHPLVVEFLKDLGYPV